MLYNRLLTLLAVREVMLEKESRMDSEQGNAIGEKEDEEIFRFVHPALGDDAAQKVSAEIKRLVKRQSMQDICKYLTEQEKEKKILLPIAPGATYKELLRVGMPEGEGFTIRNFQKYYKK